MKNIHDDMNKTNDGVSIYRDHIRLVISPSPAVSSNRSSQLSQRGEVKSFSKKSRTRMVKYLSSCVAQYQHMGTLTMRNLETNGKRFKICLNEYLNWFMEAQKSSAVSSCSGGRVPKPQSIFWFLEFQKRGAPHVHFFYTSYVYWEPAAQKWCEVIGEPDSWRTATRFEALEKGRGGCISYARKYANKEQQKQIPENYKNVGRFWGIRGMKETLAAAHVVRSKAQVEKCREDLWISVLNAEAEGKVRVFRWEKRKGATIIATQGNTLDSAGIMAMCDQIIVNDILFRGQDRIDRLAENRAKEVENELRRQRRQA